MHRLQSLIASQGGRLKVKFKNKNKYDVRFTFRKYKWHLQKQLLFSSGLKDELWIQVVAMSFNRTPWN